MILTTAKLIAGALCILAAFGGQWLPEPMRLALGFAGGFLIGWAILS